MFSRSAEGFGLNSVHIVDYLNTFYTGSSASKNAELWMSVNRYKKASECIAQLKAQNYK
jgi:tRNA (guanosine-2'-O-)-methyltransferase